MQPFADTLDDFSRSLGHSAGAMPGASARTTRYSLEAALDIYRNNWRHNLRAALAGAYPVLEQVVGTEFFHHLASRFMEVHPSTSGNLHDYGAALPAFLHGFAAAQSLPYLPDLAALEWACHRAYFAQDENPLDLQALARVPEDELEQLAFALHPACALLSSAWPVAAIWHAHQPGAPEDFHIDLDAGLCRLLVGRSEGKATLTELAADEFLWLSRICAGATLGQATTQTLESHPDFNPGTLLPRLALNGTFVRFTLEYQT
ncbi:MAG: putative DNA-binding domain-containing protein [Betaproteobacteria bacterium]|nr:putative DNA-binding domain-containing protein [Betaproteobacteria bacterium]